MRRAAALFAGLLVAAFLPVMAASAPANAASGACTSSSGVTVAVDYGSLGGGVVVRCAHTSGTGLDALRAAGFSTEGTQKDGPAFVCRIDGKPSAAKESCVNTPPRSAYWSYWIGTNGGGWKYSQSAASNRRVTPGGFEGWRFGSGSQPSVAPVRAGSADSSGDSGAGSGSAADGSGTVVAPSGPGSADGKALPKPKPRTADTPAPTPTGPSTPSTAAKPVDAKSPSSGNDAAPWIAAGVVLLLIAAAVITQRRRAS